MNMKKIFKEEESIKILKILGLIINIRKCLKISEENISQEFRLKNIDKTRNYVSEKINQIELISKKHKKVRRIFNYIKHLLILLSTVTGSVSISAFVCLVGISIGIMSFAKKLKNCIIT